MNSFLFDLKGQATVHNGLLIILILAFILNRYKKRKTAMFLLSISIIIFLLCSTSYLPDYLAGKSEQKYSPVSLPINNIDSGRVLIHVLGSGYTLDKRLPANAQIGLVALGRLAEAIRIHRSIKNSVIICSGYSSIGLETQAQVTKRAAIVLGVEEGKLETLNNPGTTGEEAKELGRRYDKSSTLFIVTDAMHMPRAIKLFKAEGFDPIAAPTNYKVTEGPGREGMKWWPSFDNIGLMNYVIHEWLGGIKASISR
ncbi:MAG: ElyC/SanA/YdcF family protein [Ferruginibacter sp.]